MFGANLFGANLFCFPAVSSKGKRKSKRLELGCVLWHHQYLHLGFKLERGTYFCIAFKLERGPYFCIAQAAHHSKIGSGEI